MARVTSRAGEWIKVPVQDGEWPLQIAIDGGVPQAAFLDRVKVGGRIDAFAAIRCPADLRPGRSHQLRVITPTRVVEAQLIVQP